MQAQQVPVLLILKTIRRPDTVSYPALSPGPTASCRPDFRACGHNIYKAFYRHAWNVLDQLAKPTFRYWSRNSEGPMDTVASGDVPPPVLEFDSDISLVIDVKMTRSYENHLQNHWVITRYAVRIPHNVLHNFGTVGDSPWPKVKLSHRL